jgi:predicted RNA-binding protein with RPS1 domain
MYIDIGTTIDGLCHVADASDKYYVHSLADKYEAGQEIDVWICKVDAKTKVLRFQTFPYHYQDVLNRSISFKWSKHTVGSPINGTIVRFSDYGSYVDVGAPVLAFLHRHKMKSNRRQRKLMAWEINPLGTKIEGWIYRIDPNNKRIEITNYPQEMWDYRFPRPHELFKSEEEKQKELRLAAHEEEDEEERKKKENLLSKKKQRKARVKNDDDDDDEETDDIDEFDTDENSDDVEQEDDYENDDEDDEDELNADEVFQATGKKLLMNDFDDENDKKKLGNKDKSIRKIEGRLNVARKSTPEEIFRTLSKGRFWITVSLLRKWDKIQLFLKSGKLTALKLRQIFRDAGGYHGTLTITQFETFMNLFAKEMNLKEVKSEEDNDFTEEELKEEVEETLETVLQSFNSTVEKLRSSQQNSTSDAKQSRVDNVQYLDDVSSDIMHFGKEFDLPWDEEDREKQQTVGEDMPIPDYSFLTDDLSSSVSEELSLSTNSRLSSSLLDVTDLTQERSTTINIVTPKKSSAYDEILKQHFNFLHQNSRNPGLTIQDILQWKLVTSMIKDKTVTTETIKELFLEITFKKQFMNYHQFVLFAEKLEFLDRVSPEYHENQEKLKMKIMKMDQSLISSSTSVSLDSDQIADDDEESVVEEITSDGMNNEAHTDLSDVRSFGKKTDEKSKPSLTADQLLATEFTRLKEASTGIQLVSLLDHYDLPRFLIRSGYLTKVELKGLFDKFRRTKKLLDFRGFRELAEYLEDIKKKNQSPDESFTYLNTSLQLPSIIRTSVSANHASTTSESISPTATSSAPTKDSSSILVSPVTSTSSTSPITETAMNSSDYGITDVETLIERMKSNGSFDMSKDTRWVSTAIDAVEKQDSKELLRASFFDYSKGKGYVTANDIMNMDVVIRTIALVSFNLVIFFVRLILYVVLGGFNRGRIC